VTCKGSQEITLKHEREHTRDLSLYIRDKLRICESHKASEIRATVQQRVSGVSFWVVLIVQILNGDKTRGRVHMLEQHLEALPKDLHQLFGSILQCGSSESGALLLTFQWLLFADRPLALPEIYFAMITDESLNVIQDWQRLELSMADMENFVLDASRGLAEITKGRNPTAQLIHESVREYLLDSWMPSLYGHSASVLAALSLIIDSTNVVNNMCQDARL
jgi:hypothetical protein